MKVYVIEAAYGGLFKNPNKERDNLGKAIGAMATAVNTPVFFHDYAKPAGSWPVIILECSEAFMESVKKLPGFGTAREKTSSTPTTRSAELWSYFTGGAVQPIHRTPPKKPPRQFKL